MKGILNKLALIAAALVISAIPILAEDGMINMTNDPALEDGKNQCVLASMNCPGSTFSIQDRIDSIQREIDKGNSVYTNEELKSLERKLDEIRKDYENLTGGAYGTI